MPQEERLEDVIYFLMDRTMRRSRQFTHRIFNEEGFNVSLDQWIVIKCVSENPGISQGEIAGMTYKDAPTLTRMIDLMVTKGLMERRVDPKDRRRYAIYLTDEGLETVKVVGPKVIEIRAAGLEGVSLEDLEVAKRVINQIFENVD